MHVTRAYGQFLYGVIPLNNAYDVHAKPNFGRLNQRCFASKGVFNEHVMQDDTHARKARKNIEIDGADRDGCLQLSVDFLNPARNDFILIRIQISGTPC